MTSRSVIIIENCRVFEESTIGDIGLKLFFLEGFKEIAASIIKHPRLNQIDSFYFSLTIIHIKTSLVQFACKGTKNIKD